MLGKLSGAVYDAWHGTGKEAKTDVEPIKKKKPMFDISDAFDEEEGKGTKQQKTSTETQDNINPIMKKEPLSNTISGTSSVGTNNDNSYSDTSIDVDSELDTVDTNSEDSVSEVFKDEEQKEETGKILKRSDEEKTKEYIDKTLKRIINGENLLENMQTFMDFIRIIPDNDYEENIDNYAIVLANATINGEKIFKDTEDAKQFINKIRNGVKTSKRYIKPRAQKQIKQEIQMQKQLTPMIANNIKRRTNAINVYQY